MLQSKQVSATELAQEYLQTIAKENATIAAAKKNFVFILKIFALNVYKYSIANINKNK